MSLHIKWKATLSVLCAILLLAGTFFFWGMKSRRTDLERRIDAKENSIRALMDVTARQVFTPYDTRIRIFLQTRSGIVAAFAKRERQRLFALSGPLFQGVLKKENPFFAQLTFFTPDNRVFLRVNEPEHFGDDLGPSRPMIMAVNQAQKGLSGYEIGGDGLLYRVVEPVFFHGVHVGAVEFGIRVQQLLEELRAASDTELAVLVSKNRWQEVRGSAGNTVADLGNYVRLKWFENIFDKLPAGFDFAPGHKRVEVEGRTCTINLALPLKDYQGEEVAAVAFAMDTTDDLKEFQNFTILTVALTIAVSILAFLILHFSFGAMLKKLMQLNMSFKDYSAKLKASNLELEDSRKHLEEVINDRTRHLAKTNEDLSLEIIERKRIEQELRTSEEKRAKVQEIARLGSWESDFASGRFNCSEEAMEIFGLDKEKFNPSPSYEDFIRPIHPADRKFVQKSHIEALYDRKPYNIDYRIVLPDGTERVIRDVAEVTFSPEDGRPLHMFGTVQDITQVKQTNKQLLLASHVFESSIEGIIITDANGTIQMVNRAFTDITGYTEKEAVGANPRMLRSDRHDGEFFKEMWDGLIRKGRWQGEIWNRRKNGEVYAQWLTINAIKDSNGNATNYVGVFHDMTEIKLHEKQLRYQAHHDTLTNLPNRLLFRDRLGIAMMHAQRNRKKVAVLFLDLDNFKRINDSLGHTIGDLLLKDVAERLSRSMRESDTVARYGGDEFIIVIEDVEQPEDALLAAQRVTKAIEPPFYLQDHELYITVSLGITFFPDDGGDQETLIRNADTAMYRAKEVGKNNYQIFTPAMNQKVRQWLSVETSLRKALEQDEFLVHYQPKVNVITGAIEGVEALVRWQHKNGELVSPKEFIPLAEDTGLVMAIGERVVQIACSDVKSWHDKGYRISVSVNLSPRQFRQNNLVEMVAAALLESELPPNALMFEITEGTVMDNEEHAVNILWEFMRIGIGLSIDDFGTGYSSLYYLKQLPIQELKIDRRFIRDLLKNEDDLAITTAIISMAKSLGLKVVAEGVESAAQFSFLRSRGCEQMQGYLFSRPVPADELLRMLEEGKRFDVAAVKTSGNQIYLPFGE